MKRSKISYKNKKVSIGLDVHKSFYVACAVCEGEVLKKCRMPATTDNVLKFIKSHYEGSEIQTCYEAGFSGFVLHRDLASKGIKNLVVDPASMEIASNNRVKTDKRDAEKLAIHLDGSRLRSIHIPEPSREHKRTLTRLRRSSFDVTNKQVVALTRL